MHDELEMSEPRRWEVRAPSGHGRHVARLRRLAEVWPSLNDEDRAQLEAHLHELRQKAAAS